MTLKRAILEMGAGTDLHGGNYTKAAVRAVDDALHHSSLTFLRSLNIDPKDMHVNVTIGVQQPQKVDVRQVQDSLPHGVVDVHVRHGGLDVTDPEVEDVTVIASAALEVYIDID